MVPGQWFTYIENIVKGFRKSGLTGRVVPGLGLILHENIINVFRKSGFRGEVIHSHESMNGKISEKVVLKRRGGHIQLK